MGQSAVLVGDVYDLATDERSRRGDASLPTDPQLALRTTPGAAAPVPLGTAHPYSTARRTRCPKRYLKMRSPLCWMGGKSRLARKIVELMPEHANYAEAFARAGWVFFAKQESRNESVNDLNSDLVSFYRVLQSHLEEFCRQFKWLLASREWFEDWNRQLAAGGLTDIQRAARFYYVQRQTFGGKLPGFREDGPVFRWDKRQISPQHQ